MPRGRKPGTKLSQSHREALSASLKGHVPWNKGRKTEKPSSRLSAEEKREATLAAVKKAAVTRKLRTAQKYILSAPGEWSSVQFHAGEGGDLISAVHECGAVLQVQPQTIRKWGWSSGLCKKCYPVFRGTSEAEQELADFCRQHTMVGVRQRLASFECDIVLPDHKIAIEYDGLYWHSEKSGYPRYRHLEKTEAIERIGWQLIHVFEDEWVKQRQIVEDRLLHLMKKTKRKVYARRCVVEKIAPALSREFVEKHHIQGAVPAKHHLGLMHEGELVAVATFGRCRFRKDHVWELLRFCSARGTSVIGGASKLLSSFRSQHSGSIISYADRRWSRGGVYESLGFTLLGTSPPAYHYFKGDLRANRLTFQKARLKELPSYDQSLTEAEIMAKEGWNRIYDCGTLIYSLK
jgi:very-short-patch-repair endonuclease